MFAPRVRKIIAPGKEPGSTWIDTHRTAHALGLKTHCTMLYAHVETHEERIEHLLTLRDLQDETGGFMAFIPLPFHPENTVFERRGWKHTTGMDDLKMIAVSRLMLDNIEHVKAYWIMISTPLAQVALHFGANDIQGTVVEEKIAHAAGRGDADRGEGRVARPRDPRGRAHPRAARHLLQQAADVRRPMIRLGRVDYINTFPLAWASRGTSATASPRRWSASRRR